MAEGNSGPSAQEALLGLVGEHDRGVLVTLRRGGRAQLSNVNYAWDSGSRMVRVSITDGRAKARNLARDPRASFHVTSEDGWAWTVVDGVAELTPVAEDPHDATVDELIEVYRAIRGEHPDWDEYRAAMVSQRRLVVRLTVEHVYGQLRQG
ncbi:PPOX class F420-dependent oxidoreductase [Streptomyces axinellae]|uniref:PPOX class F420-dependent oxidoreductase n=1 Tax=Streptomyces axinellae TaxID=552788 RepID=A0ABN3Q1P8_9ACTN